MVFLYAFLGSDAIDCNQYYQNWSDGRWPWDALFNKTRKLGIEDVEQCMAKWQGELAEIKGTLTNIEKNVRPKPWKKKCEFCNQELFELRCSIEKEGVLVPLLVRKNPHGDGYEIISGHRRKEAALWTGLTKVPVIIRELDDDQSVIAMIDSNLQREKILPSEKAFAYKMRLEAMKHQGRLESDTSDPLEPRYKTKLVNVSELEAEIQKLGKVKIQQKDGAGGKRSNEQLASMVGESVTQIKRYIRLTHLIPKILDMVDKEILAIRSAVEISFLSEEEQYELHAVMELEHSIPNISQANRLKRMSQQKCLDMDKIYEILQEIKSNQKEQIKLPLERIGKYFPTAYTPKQQVDLIEKLLKNWAKQNVK